MKSLRMISFPSAFLPLAMSAAALATIVVGLVIHGTAPQADEGTAAHIWQLLMGCQVLFVAYFALRWVPQSPKQALPILILQLAAVLAALAPVFVLGW
jgi:peptidoglycan/LPS O-acetylase OafA/YrhL